MDYDHKPSEAQAQADAASRTLSIHWQPYDLVTPYRLWLAISGTIIGIGVVFMLLNIPKYGAPFRLGIDFTGGTLISQSYPAAAAETIDEPKVRAIVAQFDPATPVVQTSIDPRTGNETILIRGSTALAGEAGKENLDKLLDELRLAFGDPVAGTSTIEEVSPTISGDLINKALTALFWGNLLVFTYVAIRMRLDFAAFGILALVHDVLVSLGFAAMMSYLYAWEINSWIVAVILTIIGYSINDSIVIFDRIRENLQLHSGHPFPKLVNYSLVQTMTRSILASVTVFLVLIAMIIGQMIVRGAGGLIEFNSVMLVGMVSGVYSTVCTAPTLLVWYYEHARAKGKKGFVADIAAAREEARLQERASHIPVVGNVHRIDEPAKPAESAPRTIKGKDILGAAGASPATVGGPAKPKSVKKKKRW